MTIWFMRSSDSIFKIVLKFALFVPVPAKNTPYPKEQYYLYMEPSMPAAGRSWPAFSHHLCTFHNILVLI